jgi:S-adenosylmethionine hydrolase
MMKGVLLGVQPELHFVDLSHEIAPQDIFQAALHIHTAYRYFPKGTIHLVVVDPTVGSGRRPLLITSGEGHYFIGPDNGTFTLIYRNHADLRVYHVTADHYFLKVPGGKTFQGRDVFAPIAAWLARGVETDCFGEIITDYVQLNIPIPVVSDTEILGQVIHVDHFGNLMTNLTAEVVDPFMQKAQKGLLKDCLLELRGVKIRGISVYYAETSPGAPGMIMSSSNHLEVYTYLEDASKKLSVSRGEPVVFRTS